VESAQIDPGDAAAFAAHFADVEPMLRAVAAGVTGRPGMVEDVVQEAALVGLRKFDSFEEGTSFTAWMAKIVRLTALNLARKAGREGAAATGVDPDSVDAGPEPESERGEGAFDRKGRFPEGERLFDDRVLHALNQLEETARVCLLLRVLQDMPYKEISQTLEIPEGTAMSHVHRARAAMRQSLAGHAGSSRRE